MDHNYAASASSSARIELVDGSPEEDDKDQPQNGNNFGANVEKEHMFDKVVTPSDVGKLNRLVIPKQHAEKYFPLDSSRDEKGLLLNFEDRTGKAWRFRYSYWNSSQSYVMTKGWSRFVKEKKLDAGDIVSFHRGNNKFFIDWRRRPRPDDALLPPPPLLHFSFHHRPPPLVGAGWGGGGGGSGSIAAPAFVLRSSYPYDRDPPHHPYHHHNNNHHHHPVGAIWDHIRRPGLFPVNAMSMLPSVPHPHWIRSSSTSTTGNYSSSPHSAPVHLSRISSSSPSGDDHHQRVVQQQQVHREVGGAEPMVFESVPVVQGKAAGKRLRLFGVNMDCPNSNSNDNYEPYEDALPSIPASSSTSDHHHHHHHRDHHQAMLPNHEDRLPLQLSLTVDKGKLSSSSSSMSLDLDM